MNTRVRRNRSSRGVDLKTIESLMSAVVSARSELESLQANLKRDTDALLAAMKEAGITRHELDGLVHIVAELQRSPGRATNVVDPKAYRGLVSEQDFYESISVSVTKARELVPGKQLAAITKHTPGKPGEETVKVTVRGS